MYREIGALREVLSKQAVGVLIGAALPGVLRVTEVHRDVGRQGEADAGDLVQTKLPGVQWLYDVSDA